MSFFIEGFKSKIREKIDYYKDELKPHKDYEYTMERYHQIEGIIEGLEVILKLLDDLDKEVK